MTGFNTFGGGFGRMGLPPSIMAAMQGVAPSAGASPQANQAMMGAGGSMPGIVSGAMGAPNMQALLGAARGQQGPFMAPQMPGALNAPQSTGGALMGIAKQMQGAQSQQGQPTSGQSALQRLLQQLGLGGAGNVPVVPGLASQSYNPLASIGGAAIPT